MLEFLRSDWGFVVSFIILILVESLFFYGFLGTKKWKKDAKEYGEDVFWKDNPFHKLTTRQIIISFLEFAIPISYLAVWIKYIH